jgi:hypothetical protein
MIRLCRTALPPETASLMARYTEDIAQSGKPVNRADELWKHTTVRRRIRPALISALEGMAPGQVRCMYCGDNQGTAIDHFEPQSRAPLRTFDWTNHLLACSLCNSHYKRCLYPCDEEGRPLLVDPTVQEPLNHFHLVLGAGEYTAPRKDGPASRFSGSIVAPWSRAVATRT